MIKIRSFEKADRQIVRQICCDVADMGERIDNFFPDREFAADLLTNYYTDYEPESSFVAEFNGQVVAYINGCLDNRRYGLVILFLIIPKLIIKGIIRGVFLRPKLWMILQGAFKNWRRIFSWRKKSFHSHQGHLHIGIAKDLRGQRIGEQLVKELLVLAKCKGIDELAASVHGDNTIACRFFERLGFSPQEKHPSIMVYKGKFKEYNSISYVKKIDL